MVKLFVSSGARLCPPDGGNLAKNLLVCLVMSPNTIRWLDNYNGVVVETVLLIALFGEKLYFSGTYYPLWVSTLRVSSLLASWRIYFCQDLLTPHSTMIKTYRKKRQCQWELSEWQQLTILVVMP